MNAFLNGRLVPLDQLSLGFADAGFVFGATVTDFCRTYRHRLFQWPRHLARLRRDCRRLGVPLLHDDAELTAAATELVSQHAAELSDGDDLALITFATPGPLGYLTGHTENGPPTLGMHTLPLSVARYRRFFSEGIVLAEAGPLADGVMVPNEVKHRNRLSWWLAEQAVQSSQAGAVPVLVNEREGAADTAIGAVLAVQGDRILCSPRGCVLESVSAEVVEELCNEVGIGFGRGPIRFEDPNLSEVLLTGSGFGVAGVRKVVTAGCHRCFPWPGPILQRLLDAWSGLVGMRVEGQFV